MSHSTVHRGDLPFIERPYRPQDEPRHVASLTEALGLENSRASVWRYPPGERGPASRRRPGGGLRGARGDDHARPRRAARDGRDSRGGFARVGTGTEIQVRNESHADAVVLAWGAPAVTGEAEILDDLP